MNNSGEPVIKRILAFIPVILIPAAAAVLGYLQLTWIDRAALIEEDRFRKSVWIGVSQALAEIYDDLRILGTAFQRLHGEDVEDEDIRQGVRFWLTQTRLPEALTGAWILRGEPEATFLDTSNETIQAETLDVPQGLRSMNRLINSGDSSERYVEALAYLARAGYGVMPIDPDLGRLHTIILEFDFDSIFERSLPVFLGEELPEVPFRIIRTNPRGVVYEAGKPGEWERPEIVISLKRIVTMMSFFPRTIDLPPEFNAMPVSPPAERSQKRITIQRVIIPRETGKSGFDLSLVLSSQPEPEPERENGSRDSPLDEWGLLQVYYPEGEIKATIEQWRVSNTILSVGLLLLLIASSFAIYRLYRRTGKLRTVEQEFVSAMSHELRLPVSVIKAMSDNLAGGIVQNPERVRQYGTELHSVAVRLAGMVEGILMYAGLQSGNRKGNRTSIVVDDFLHSILNPMKELAISKGVDLRIELGLLPGRIVADEAAIRLVIENLLSNALNHGVTAEGSKRVRLEIRRIPFDKLLVIVEDQGVGIPGKEQRRVFQPFYRGEYSIKEQRPGSGLGLHLVRRVVALMDGSVSLESPYADAAGGRHRGCRFTVEIPFLEE